MQRARSPSAPQERIARWTLLPVGNGEGLQILRYGPGQKYEGAVPGGRGRGDGIASFGFLGSHCAAPGLESPWQLPAQPPPPAAAGHFDWFFDDMVGWRQIVGGEFNSSGKKSAVHGGR